AGDGCLGTFAHTQYAGGQHHDRDAAHIAGSPVAVALTRVMPCRNTRQNTGAARTTWQAVIHWPHCCLPAPGWQRISITRPGSAARPCEGGEYEKAIEDRFRFRRGVPMVHHRTEFPAAGAGFPEQ